MIEVKAADLFCGAGGASNGLVRACRELGLKLDLLAINHWPTAVATHSKNHPSVRHLCESIDRVDPLKEVPGGRLHLLLAGPECTHFSAARGGRPVNPQSRASAWQILKWAQELYIDTILIENVPEFRTWGPIGANGKPLKSKAGETYQAFLSALRSLGYKVDDKILNSADYGDPTTRRRNFILARRGRHAVQWPGATHSKAGGKTLFGRTQRWKPAREVIDWTVQGKSIFNRKTPLAPATMARIIAGLEKFGGPDLKPFLVVLRQHMAGQSIDGPLPALAAGGTHVGLAQPFIVPVNHGAGDLRSNSVDEPLPTLTARANQYLVQPYVLSQASGGAPRPTEEPLPTMTTDGAIALVQPFIVDANFGGEGGRVKSVDEPLGSIPGSNRFAVAQPFMVPLYMERQGQTPRTHSVDEPVPTIPATGGGKFGVVEPFIMSAGSRVVNARGVEEPMPTVTCSDRLAIAEPYLVQTAERRRMEVDSVDDPLRTVTAMAGRCFGLAEPFVTKYNGTSKSAQSVDDPLETVTSKDRFGLVQPVVDGYMLDINFRMLQPHELAGAMSFPKDYVFTGKREDVIKQIGNAWAGELATALCREILQDQVPARKPKAGKKIA
jgi:DNA (cytosine-5)-methyltransferase 1